MNDIEVLEERVTTLKRHIKNYEESDCRTNVYQQLVKECNAIENLLKERQSDKERIKELEEERDLYRSQVNSAFDRGFIHISKIEEMLEELDKEEKELQDSISEEEREEYSDANISFDLMHIEIQRRVLKKLLKENR